MIARTLKYLVLPATHSDFEAGYLVRMNRIATWFFVAHLPAFVLIAWLNQTNPLLAGVLTAATLAGPVLARLSFCSQRAVSIVMGITAMLMGGLLVHFGQGPIQIEMHFYFFVLLALLAVFANPMVIVVAAATVALHHALLWILIPSSVFNYDAPLWVVAVHSAFVILESVGACFISRVFYENVIGLERKVNQRTAELRQRGQEMRRLLDSVQQGFFSIDREGFISEERSKAANSLLAIGSAETLQSPLRFSDVLRSYDPVAADWFELGFEDVLTGVMPLEVTIDQLPKTCVVHSRSLMIEYSPVVEGDHIAGLAVTVSDVTADVERQRLAQDNRELLAVFEKVSNDSARVKSFLHETESIIATLQAGTLNQLTLGRLVHTLKGNSAAFGLERIATACHDIEDSIAEYGSAGDSPAWSRLFDAWKVARDNFHRFMKTDKSNVAFDQSQYDALLIAIKNGESHEQLLERIQAWERDRIEVRLQSLAEQARYLSKKLDKKVRAVIDDCGLSVCKQRWSSFWASLTHVIRNAVDHGIELPEERLRLNKSIEGTLTLKTFVEQERFYLEIHDDGRGVDWERVRESALRKGLPAATSQDLVNALFVDGVSTAGEVTELSGRGIGMASVKQSAEELGGSITVQSQWHHGTQVRFCFPMSALSQDSVDGIVSESINESSTLRSSAAPQEVIYTTVLHAV